MGLRAVPIAAAVGAAHLLALAGLLPRTAAGEPPLAADARFGAVAGLAVILAAAAGVLGWRLTRRPARRLGQREEEGKERGRRDGQRRKTYPVRCVAP